MTYAGKVITGDHKTRLIRRVRVQRDRRLSVISVGVGGWSAVYADVGTSGRIGLGIAPERGDTALTSISPEARRLGHKPETEKVWS